MARRALYEPIRDLLRAARQRLRRGLGLERYMVTRAVTLKALIRVAADLRRRRRRGRRSRGALEAQGRALGRLARDFRADGFYERFPARGQVERVGRIHRRLDQVLGITPIGPNRDGGD